MRFSMIFLLSVSLAFTPLTILAGDLESPAPPEDPISAYYTLEDLFNRLESGITGTKRTGAFKEPLSGPDAYGHTLDEIMNIAPKVDDTNGATTLEVMNGKTFWGLRTDGTWGPQTGILSTLTLNPNLTTQPSGFYEEFNLSTIDTDLISGNIRGGATIFGVTGQTKVIDTNYEPTEAANTGDIRSGKNAFVNGNPVSGSLLEKALSPGSTAVEAGIYSATTLNSVDTDLRTDNIKSGVTIFGVSGRTQVMETGVSNPAGAGDIRVGKTAFANGNQVDGALVERALSPDSENMTSGIYNLSTNLSSIDSDLNSTNIKKGVTIFGISGDSNVVDTNAGTAGSGDIRDGKTAFVNGNQVDGAIPTMTLNDSGILDAGIYTTTTLSSIDTDLHSANVKSGINIFGIDGTFTSDGDAAPEDISGGKVAYVDGAKVIGTNITCAKCEGILSSEGRWCDNGNGTVTDMESGLIWLKNAGWGGERIFYGFIWNPDTCILSAVGTALERVALLSEGDAGNSDGSQDGDWRLPTLGELKRLTTGTEKVSSGEKRKFENVQAGSYWSSHATSSNVKVVNLNTGNDFDSSPQIKRYVWPVRSK